jgi:DNA-binding Xre family transcriptional regulator
MLLSPSLLLILAIASLLISLVTLAIAWQQHNLSQQCKSHLLHISSHHKERELLIKQQWQLLETQEKLEDTIGITTSAVRTIHKGIAAIPFGILEAIPVTRHVTLVVRGTHDLISDVVYSSIGIATKTTGKVIRKGIKAPSDKKLIDK